MANFLFVTKITVNGTKKSEREGGLDAGESATFKINPGEYDKKLNEIDDLLVQINESAYFRGEWISSILIDDTDLVKDIVLDILDKSRGSEDVALAELMEIGMFMHAEPEWFSMIISQVKKQYKINTW